eukprot:904320-Prymnesium_polylepis.2
MSSSLQPRPCTMAGPRLPWTRMGGGGTRTRTNDPWPREGSVPQRRSATVSKGRALCQYRVPTLIA